MISSIAFIAASAQEDEFDLPPLEPPYVKAPEEAELPAEEVQVSPPAAPENSPPTPVQVKKPAPKPEDVESLSTEFTEEEASPAPTAPPVVETPVPAPVPVEPTRSPVQTSSPKTRSYLQSKGLYKIDQTTGTYYYKTEMQSKNNNTGSFRIGNYQTPAITVTVDDINYNFTNFYTDGDIPFFMYDYEWRFFESFKQFTVQTGLGLFIAQGNGLLLTDPVQEAREEYTFFALPLNLGLTFRLQLYDKQLFVPYASGGLSYYVLFERRDDGDENNLAGIPAAYGAGGLLVNLSSIDKQTAFIFDREYNIHNLYLALEYRVIQSFSEDVDMSSNVFNVGITVDY